MACVVLNPYSPFSLRGRRTIFMLVVCVCEEETVFKAQVHKLYELKASMKNEWKTIKRTSSLNFEQPDLQYVHTVFLRSLVIRNDQQQHYRCAVLPDRSDKTQLVWCFLFSDVALCSKISAVISGR